MQATTKSNKSIGNRVGVVIVHWNTPNHLERCLTALKVQTRPPDRILVVDNASREIPAAVHRYPDVQFLLLGENIGFAAASNLGVAALGETDWIALVNPDVTPAPDWLDAILQAARDNPPYDFFASRLVSAADPQVLDGAGDAYHVSGLAWRRGHALPEQRAVAAEPKEVFSACAAAALYRRSVWNAVGGFDESYFCYFEDVDLAFRLRLAGYRCRYVPGAVAQHVGSASTGRRSDFAVYHGHRNLVWTYWKNMPAPLCWIYLPQHILFNLLVVVRFALRGQAGAICRAKWDALRGLARVFRERRRVQQSRRTGRWELRRAMNGLWSICTR